MFTCELTGKVYKTKRGALQSAKREMLRREQAEYIRLHAESPVHFLELLADKGKEFWGWEVKTSLLSVELREEIWGHFDFGLKVKFKIKAVFPKRVKKSEILCEYLRNHFNCLGAVSDNPWATLSDASHNAIVQSAWLSFAKFPKLKEKHDEYCKFKIIRSNWMNEKLQIEREARMFAFSQKDYVEVSKEINEISKQIESLNREMSKLTSNRRDLELYYTTGYVSFWENLTPEPFNGALCESFGSV